MQTGERVLEIGFGTGHSLVALAAAAGEDGRVDGVDISEGMADVAGRRLKKHGLGRSRHTPGRRRPASALRPTRLSTA